MILCVELKRQFHLVRTLKLDSPFGSDGDATFGFIAAGEKLGRDPNLEHGESDSDKDDPSRGWTTHEAAFGRLPLLRWSDDAEIAIADEKPGAPR